MSFKAQDDRSHLFLMRLRAKGAGKVDDLDEVYPRVPPAKREGLGPWFGTVQRVVSGETYDFCGWAELIECLGAMLDDQQVGNATDGDSTSGEEK